MSAIALGRGDALLLVDIQRDFLPGGALPVAAGDRVVALAQRCADRFAQRRLPVYASRDWHPPTHASFRAQGGPWTAHCVAGSAGAQFADALRLPEGATVVSKGTDPAIDAYSAFGGTDLADQLHRAGVKRLFIAGLATDYCVLASVLDALAQGFSVIVLRDAIAAVDVQPGDGDRAIAAMREAGARIADSIELDAEAAADADADADADAWRTAVRH